MENTKKAHRDVYGKSIKIELSNRSKPNNKTWSGRDDLYHITMHVLGTEYPSPKKVNLSIMVGLYKPNLLSY